MENVLKNFLIIPYDELEERNLAAKAKRSDRANFDAEKLEAEYRKYLKEEKRLKAVTVVFSDLEGRFQMLDYDKKFLLNSSGNLTFDGSSIRGFSEVEASDLRLRLDWASFYWLPADVFGNGKVILFADILTPKGEIHPADFRARLKQYADELFQKNKFQINVANEVEGFLLEGMDVESKYSELDGFQVVSPGGYYHSLPQDRLKLFIDATAEAQRAMGFQNEKDHPEVAPSQFELNYTYSDIINAADQIQLYKLTARQVARSMNATASFLPKPITGINGSGMHTNISIFQNGKNLFYKKNGKDGVSELADNFIDRVLASATDISLILNPSVNAYRRLDSHFEAPNQIKYSAFDRTSMVRIPLGNEKSTRLEIRSVGPDANPYLLLFILLKVGLEGPKQELDEAKRQRTRVLPGNIYDALRIFKTSDLMTRFLGKEIQEKFADLKETVANRSPKELGKTVKRSEVIYHHEITNQLIWNQF
ncbi:MAG: glutamine synthetase family protein [bacterium]